MRMCLVLLNATIFILSAFGALAVWGFLVGTNVTYELDTGQLVTFWGDAEFCRTAKMVLQDGGSVETTSPWGMKSGVRHVWCNRSGTD